jgi:hypothetical protein
MEYCKLLENGSRNNEQNISSLNRLNEIFIEDSTKDFQKLFNQNLQFIDNIKGSDFYNKIKSLRNKKFGHADNDEINKPFKFEGFRTTDFDKAFEHLRMIKIIFNNFASSYGRVYDFEIPSREDRTKNFIKFHAEYQSYYMQNYFSARKDRLSKK